MENPKRDGLARHKSFEYVYLFITPHIFYKLSYEDVDNLFTGALQRLNDDLKEQDLYLLRNDDLEEQGFFQNQLQNLPSDDDKVDDVDFFVKKIAIGLGLNSMAIKSLVMRFMYELAEKHSPQTSVDI